MLGANIKNLDKSNHGCVKKVIRISNDNVMEDGERELLHLSSLISDVSMNTAAADWDAKESSKYQQSILDARKAAAEVKEEEENLMNFDVIDFLSG